MSALEIAFLVVVFTVYSEHVHKLADLQFIVIFNHIQEVDDGIDVDCAIFQSCHIVVIHLEQKTAVAPNFLFLFHCLGEYGFFQYAFIDFLFVFSSFQGFVNSLEVLKVIVHHGVTHNEHNENLRVLCFFHITHRVRGIGLLGDQLDNLFHVGEEQLDIAPVGKPDKVFLGQNAFCGFLRAVLLRDDSPEFAELFVFLPMLLGEFGKSHFDVRNFERFQLFSRYVRSFCDYKVQLGNCIDIGFVAVVFCVVAENGCVLFQPLGKGQYTPALRDGKGNDGIQTPSSTRDIECQRHCASGAIHLHQLLQINFVIAKQSW